MKNTGANRKHDGTRDTGTAVFHPLSELVGIYVEVVE